MTASALLCAHAPATTTLDVLVAWQATLPGGEVPGRPAGEPARHAGVPRHRPADASSTRSARSSARPPRRGRADRAARAAVPRDPERRHARLRRRRRRGRRRWRATCTGASSGSASTSRRRGPGCRTSPSSASASGRGSHRRCPASAAVCPSGAAVYISVLRPTGAQYVVVQEYAFRHREEVERGSRASTRRGARTDRAALRQGVGDADERPAAGLGGRRLDRVARARPRTRHRRAAARPHRRDLRPGVVGQDDPRLPRHRRGAAPRRDLRVHRRRARDGPAAMPSGSA